MREIPSLRSLLNPVAGALLCSFVGASAQAVAADNIVVGSITGAQQSSAKSQARAQHVFANVCIAIDASASITASENQDMMEGVKEAVRYMAKASGERFAVTIARFGEFAELGGTHIFRGEVGAEEFVKSELRYNPNKKPTEEVRQGYATNIYAGIKKCRSVFKSANNPDGLNITREKNALVVIADGIQNSSVNAETPRHLRPQIMELAQYYGVITYGIPIKDKVGEQNTEFGELISYFEDNLKIPKGEVILYKNPAVFGEKTLTLAEGVILPADGYKAVGEATKQAFASLGF